MEKTAEFPWRIRRSLKVQGLSNWWYIVATPRCLLYKFRAHVSTRALIVSPEKSQSERWSASECPRKRTPRLRGCQKSDSITRIGECLRAGGNADPLKTISTNQLRSSERCVCASHDQRRLLTQDEQKRVVGLHTPRELASNLGAETYSIQAGRKTSSKLGAAKKALSVFDF